MSDTRHRARRNRLVSATLVAILLVGSREVWSDPGLRADGLYRVVLGLGYGHLLGAALYGHRRIRAWFPEAASATLVWVTIVTALLGGFSAYRLLLAAHPAIAFPLLAAATWHVFENDTVLARSYRLGRTAPVSPSLERHAVALGYTLLALLLFLAALPDDPRLFPAPVSKSAAQTLARAGALAIGFGLVASPAPRRRVGGLLFATGAVIAPEDLQPWIPFADLFAAVTLYHLLSWLLLAGERVRPVGLVAVHAPGLLAAGALFLLPDSWGGALAWLFSVEIYLFWSVLHVVQTFVTRGIARSPARSAGASAPSAAG